jgi:hypothetical protein
MVGQSDLLSEGFDAMKISTFDRLYVSYYAGTLRERLKHLPGSETDALTAADDLHSAMVSEGATKADLRKIVDRIADLPTASFGGVVEMVAIMSVVYCIENNLDIGHCRRTAGILDATPVHELRVRAEFEFAALEAARRVADAEAMKVP